MDQKLSFLAGVAAGIVAGATIAMTVTPAPPQEMRERLLAMARPSPEHEQ
jgi:gas vesicle protein